LRTVDLEVISREERKDKREGIYSLVDGENQIGTASKLDMENGQTVESGYDMKYPKEDNYKLRFSKILRIRE